MQKCVRKSVSGDPTKRSFYAKTIHCKRTMLNWKGNKTECLLPSLNMFITLIITVAPIRAAALNRAAALIRSFKAASHKRRKHKRNRNHKHSRRFLTEAQSQAQDKNKQNKICLFLRLRLRLRFSCFTLDFSCVAIAITLALTSLV